MTFDFFQYSDILPNPATLFAVQLLSKGGLNCIICSILFFYFDKFLGVLEYWSN